MPGRHAQPRTAHSSTHIRSPSQPAAGGPWAKPGARSSPPPAAPAVPGRGTPRWSPAPPALRHSYREGRACCVCNLLNTLPACLHPCLHPTASDTFIGAHSHTVLLCSRLWHTNSFLGTLSAPWTHEGFKGAGNAGCSYHPRSLPHCCTARHGSAAHSVLSPGPIPMALGSQPYQKRGEPQDTCLQLPDCSCSPSHPPILSNQQICIPWHRISVDVHGCASTPMGRRVGASLHLHVEHACKHTLVCGGVQGHMRVPGHVPCKGP